MSEKNLISKYTIDNEIVEHIGNIASMMVLRKDSVDCADVTLYLVSKGKVIGEINVSADCGQNFGYISSVKIGG